MFPHYYLLDSRSFTTILLLYIYHYHSGPSYKQTLCLSLSIQFIHTSSHLWHQLKYITTVASHSSEDDSMVGFIILEVEKDVGFVMRQLIDQRYQRKSFDKVALLLAIDWFKWNESIVTIGISCLPEITAMKIFCTSVWFVPWYIDITDPTNRDKYFRLP